MAKNNRNYTIVKLSSVFVLVFFLWNLIQAQSFYINDNSMNSLSLSQAKMITTGIHISTNDLAIGFAGAYSPRKYLGLSIGYLKIGEGNPGVGRFIRVRKLKLN